MFVSTILPLLLEKIYGCISFIESTLLPHIFREEHLQMKLVRFYEYTTVNYKVQSPTKLKIKT